MGESKHTPEPWHLAGGNHRTLIVAGADCVAAVTHHEDRPEEDAANARLIVAAPEMLEALRLAINPHADPAAKRRAIESAIAKAEGREP